MSNSKQTLSSKVEGYSPIRSDNYSNIRVENSVAQDTQFRLNYLEKHFNLLEQRLGIAEDTAERAKYSGGQDHILGERVKLLEELILRQKADFNARIAQLEEQVKQVQRYDYPKPHKVDETISNSRLVSLEIKFEQLDRNVKILNERLAVQGLDVDSSQVLHEIRKLKEAVEECIHNQRELEIANLDARKQQLVRDHKELSFEPTPQFKNTPKKPELRGTTGSGSKKEPGSSEKKEQTYSNLKNKYGNSSKKDSIDVDMNGGQGGSSKKEKFYDDIEQLKKLVKEEKPRPKSALKSNESSKSPAKVKKSPNANKSFTQASTVDTGISPKHSHKKSSQNIQTASFDNRVDIADYALEAKRRQIDQEIEKRINEQYAERKKIEAAVNHNHKVHDKLNHQEITPMSTEKSREKEVANRLAREKKLRSEIIEKFTNATPEKRK